MKNRYQKLCGLIAYGDSNEQDKFALQLYGEFTWKNGQIGLLCSLCQGPFRPFLKTFVAFFLPRLTAPGYPRMEIALKAIYIIRPQSPTVLLRPLVALQIPVLALNDPWQLCFVLNVSRDRFVGQVAVPEQP